MLTNVGAAGQLHLIISFKLILILTFLTVDDENFAQIFRVESFGHFCYFYSALGHLRIMSIIEMLFSKIATWSYFTYFLCNIA